MSAALDALRRQYDGRKPGLMGARKEFSVLCPLVEMPDGPHFLFEVRAAGLTQGGEVCFPGGMAEPGEDPVACALRETEEELAIPRGEVDVIGPADFMANVRGFLVHPILGVVSPAGMAAMRPSPDEVAEVFTVPLSFFRETPPEVYAYRLAPVVQEDFPYQRVGITKDYPWAAGKVDLPVWYWKDHVIWGMTGRMIRSILL